jgi:dihydrofolate reductase
MARVGQTLVDPASGERRSKHSLTNESSVPCVRADGRCARAKENDMRDLEISTLVSLDGVVSPQSWAEPYFDAEAAAQSLERLQAADAFLMGRGSYEYFAPTWPTGAGPYMGRLREMPEYVFSSTLEHVGWDNTRVVRGDAIEAVRRLKAGEGGDLVAYGDGAFSQSLLEHDLVDKLTLIIHPIVVATGRPLFRPGQTKRLRLQHSEARSTGVVVVSYGREEA